MPYRECRVQRQIAADRAQEDGMYLLTPTTALDLARHRVDQDLARAELQRLAREAKAARQDEDRGNRRRRIRWTLPRPLRVRIAH